MKPHHARRTPRFVGSALFWMSLVAAVARSAVAVPAFAVTRVCGADAVDNTTNVLCASGSCSATLVRVTTAIEVTGSGCDVRPRWTRAQPREDFSDDRPGFIQVINAGNITVTADRQLQGARRLRAAERLHHRRRADLADELRARSTSTAQLDVAGDSAGMIIL